jgi:hypothetical protein
LETRSPFCFINGPGRIDYRPLSVHGSRQWYPGPTPGPF